MPIRVKICGVTTLDDAQFAAEAGADALGLNFYPESPRFLHQEQAVAIVRTLPLTCLPVGVFVARGPLPAMQEQITMVGQQVGLRAAQTYDLPMNFSEFGGMAWIPSFRVRQIEDLYSIHDLLANSPRQPAAVLIDSFVAGSMGGTGHRAPWHLLENLRLGVPLILAGGLTPDNVADAIRQVQPWGVDVASGVESSPGRKDPARVRDFLQAVRSVG